MLDLNTPLMFSDGSKLYGKLAQRYRTHSKGLFILAPSGSGKTHFIKSQQESEWIDGDELWMATNAHPDSAWWTAGDKSPMLREIDFYSDVITLQAKRLGFWIMGASNLWLRPDAVVLPDWDIHQKFINLRNGDNYDGGATSEMLDQVLDHRERIRKHAEAPVPDFRLIDPAHDGPVPIFKSISEAVEHLKADIQ